MDFVGVKETQKQTANMIPPNVSLVKYDNPVLVSRNMDKKTPKVRVDMILFLRHTQHELITRKHDDRYGGKEKNTMFCIGLKFQKKKHL